jgi:hypothetical protein
MGKMEKIKQQAIELVSEVGEVFFDTLLEEGILKDMPVIGSLAKLSGIVSTLNNKVSAD